MAGNLRFKIDWVRLILGRKFTVFRCFTLYLRAISKYKPLEGGRATIWRNDLTQGFMRYEFGGLYLEGLIHGGAYFRNFTVLNIDLNQMSHRYVSGVLQND